MEHHKALLRDRLIALANGLLATNSKMTRAAISKAAFNDNTFFTRLENDKNWTIDSFATLLRWFSDNWPEGAEWPADIPRPAPAEPAEQAS